MNLHSNDFELFGLALQYAQDRTELDARWKDLQRQIHPDRFAAQGATSQRLAMQWSVRVNEAYQRLKDPLRRAAYLCELNGAAIQAENNTAMPREFLLQQISWREALDEATCTQELEAIQAEIEALRRKSFDRCAQLLDVEHDYPQAVVEVRSLMFIERFVQDIENRFDRMDNAGS